MARIRTIKPEFPQSESIGRLSRDARLLFIQLWTIADDFGRARASSRVLAGTLYPYDDDARELIDGWLDELEQQGCIRRYEVDETHYLDIPMWLKHQKIDHPSKYGLPEFSETLAKPREPLAPDLGPRILDLGSRKEAEKVPASPPPVSRKGKVEEAWSLLSEITSRDPESCRALVGQWLRDHGDDIDLILGAIRDAESKEIAEPVSWIIASFRSGKKHNGNAEWTTEDRINRRNEIEIKQLKEREEHAKFMERRAP